MVPEEIPKRLIGRFRGILQQLPPPARGLTAGDFQVFENSLEQRINYFKESDFAAADLSGHGTYFPIQREAGECPMRISWDLLFLCYLLYRIRSPSLTRRGMSSYSGSR